MSPDAPLQQAPVSPISPGRVWFALLAAPIAWALQGLLGWFVSGAGCRSDQSYWGVPLTTLSTAAVVISVIALAVGVAGVVIGYQDWNRSGEEANLNAANGRTRASYLAAAGALISAIFTIGMIWATVGVLLVNPCGQMR